MKIKNAFVTAAAVFLFCLPVIGQRAEITVTLNETFFDVLLDSIFQNLDPLEFPIGNVNPKPASYPGNVASFAPRTECKETVKILRETNGVKTAVRFRNGKINAPLAFTGGYSAPFVGCVELGGWADTTIDLEFDAANQRLVGRARVQSVKVNGTGGLGSGVFARIIQGSIDKKVNPIEIIRLDKLSLIVPVHNAGSLRMKAVGVRTEVVGAAINIHVTYEFSKG